MRFADANLTAEQTAGAMPAQIPPPRRTPCTTEIADPQKLAAAKAEAEQEAAASEIEFTTDGWFLSRIAGKEIDRMPYTVERVAEDALRLTMMKGGQARSTEVELGSSGGARRIVIVDPQKGSLTFEQK